MCTIVREMARGQRRLMGGIAKVGFECLERGWIWAIEKKDFEVEDIYI